jgi:hypothetical protein
MKTRTRTVRLDNVTYTALMFVCPGCVAGGPDGYDGIHLLPVNAPANLGKPSWDWDGNEEAPTLSPSILTNGTRGEPSRLDEEGKPVFPRCHSYLRAGVFEFLSDCEHPLVGQKVPMVDLPEWAEKLE